MALGYKTSQCLLEQTLFGLFGIFEIFWKFGENRNIGHYVRSDHKKYVGCGQQRSNVELLNDQFWQDVTAMQGQK